MARTARLSDLQLLLRAIEDSGVRFDAHARACPICGRESRELCAEGAPLFLEWSDAFLLACHWNAL